MKAKVIDVEQDDKGNIKFIVDFIDQDGKVVQTGNPRYSMGVSKTIDDVMTQLDHDMDEHIGTLISRKNNVEIVNYIKNKNAEYVNQLKQISIGIEKNRTETTRIVGNEVFTLDENGVKSKEEIV